MTINRRWNMLAQPGTLRALGSDPEALARAVNEAMSAGDLEAVLALYADDAVLDLGALGRISAKEELRGFFQHSFSQNATWETSDYQVEGNAVTFKSRYSSDMMSSLGVTMEATEVIAIENGKIATDTWTATDESMAAYRVARAT
jgi:ketosteroid isomerase-like protein